MKKITIVIILSAFFIGMVAGVASARLLSEQVILNDVWDSTNHTLRVTTV